MASVLRYLAGSQMILLEIEPFQKDIKLIIALFVETPRKFITAKLSIRKPGSSSVLIISQNRYQTRRDTPMCFGLGENLQ